MAKTKQKSTKNTTTSNINIKNVLIGGFFVLIGLISIFLDQNSFFGEILNDTLSFLFGGFYQFFFSPVILFLGVLILFKEGFVFNSGKFLGFFLYLISVNTLIGFFLDYKSFFNFKNSFSGLFGNSASIIFAILMLLAGIYMIFRISYKKIIQELVAKAPNISEIAQNILPKNEDNFQENSSKNDSVLLKEKKQLEEMKKQLEEERKKLEKQKQENQLKLEDIPQKIHIETKKEPSLIQKIKENFSQEQENSQNQNNKDEKIQIKISPNKETPEINYEQWELPSLNFLSNIGGSIKFDENIIKAKQEEIIDKLKQFKIDVSMQGFRVGPTVIQYRLKPDDGVKLNSIVNLKADLTLALHAKSIRIQAPIPGEGVVGIEVPNEQRQAVGLKEVIGNAKFNNPKIDIPIAIGKDVNGDIVVGDLTKMPHLLVAGQTASGKSVGMNGFIISMLYKFSPSELKLIMVDPKMVELSIYNGIPHLLTPVITNPDKALNSLKWAVAEMLRRYDLATSLNARNLKEYNQKAQEKLPYIVIVIDELADLMMSGNKKEVEASIARIAQMARAVGMHLIIATQRPSVDVITGLIKANVPSRIAFTVASQIDSRTVIDKAGAEDLLGRGDMLYAPTGVLEPQRVQGVLVETEEVEAIVNYLKLNIDPNMIDNLYDMSIANGKSSMEGSIFENYNGDQDEDEEIVKKAIEIVRESKKGSTSLIQRKLGLGYARAAKILDILEEMGIVGPSNGSKPREVYE